MLLKKLYKVKNGISTPVFLHITVIKNHKVSMLFNIDPKISSQKSNHQFNLMWNQYSREKLKLVRIGLQFIKSCFERTKKGRWLRWLLIAISRVGLSCLTFRIRSIRSDLYGFLWVLQGFYIRFIFLLEGLSCIAAILSLSCDNYLMELSCGRVYKIGGIHYLYNYNTGLND